MNLRQVNRGSYPELSGYTSRDIWRDIGPGGLYLVTRMARLLELKRGEVVLDLGCGKGESSIFLAKHYGVKVFALDLWVNANTMFKHIIKSGLSDVIPLNLDASKPLPFAEEYFDAIFCMNSLSFFGGDLDTISRLSSHLKVDGVFCVGGETLNCEFSEDQLENPPQVYNFAEGVWEDDFLKLHSPPWWENLFTQVDGLEVFHCEELPDGRVMYEDQIQNSQSNGYLGLNRQQAYERRHAGEGRGPWTDPGALEQGYHRDHERGGEEVGTG